MDKIDCISPSTVLLLTSLVLDSTRFLKRAKRYSSKASVVDVCGMVQSLLSRVMERTENLVVTVFGTKVGVAVLTNGSKVIALLNLQITTDAYRYVRYSRFNYFGTIAVRSLTFRERYRRRCWKTLPTLGTDFPVT